MRGRREPLYFRFRLRFGQDDPETCRGWAEIPRGSIPCSDRGRSESSFCALPMNSGGVGAYRIPEYAQPTSLLSGGRLSCCALPTNSGGSRESRIPEYAQPTYLLSGGRSVLSYGFFAVAGGATPCMGKFMHSAGYAFAYHCCNPVVIPGSIIPRRESPPIRDDG